MGDKNKILIIEDEHDLAMLLKERLGIMGYEVYVVNDGQAGLTQARVKKPDLILLDITMPQMDGFDVCREIKSDQNTKHIKIIMLTARASVEDEKKGYEVGTDAYIKKPFETETLMKKIDELLKR